MTLNLNKYGVEMQTAWKKVCDVNSDIDWALYGYEGATFTLKLLATGSDGLEELKEELNANKIMYAFVRVIDPKTSLPKFVFLHWQGESAAGTTKGKCATHLTDIEKYFHGAHVTINARNEDEVDEAEILIKVSKATASSFNFKEKPSTMMDEAPAPVGTTHQRIVPQKELPSMNEREKFWIQEESREKERIEAERIRKISERKALEEERKRREEEESKAREATIKERERKISKIRDAETSSPANKDSSNWEMQMADDAKDEEERQRRSEELRRARNEEARQLIGQRSSNPRAVFERNTSVGQLDYRRQTSSSSSTSVTTATAHHVTSEEPKPKLASPVAAKETFQEEQIVSPQPNSPVHHRHQEEPEVRSPAAATNGGEKRKEELPVKNAAATSVHTDDIVVPPPDSFGNEAEAYIQKSNPEQIVCEPDVTSGAQQPDLIQDVAASKSVPDVMASTGRPTQQNNGASAEDFGICAVALYDYEAADDTEISFDPGQVITQIEQIDQGWWYGFSSGHYGLFPANYVEIIDSSEIEQH